MISTRHSYVKQSKHLPTLDRHLDTSLPEALNAAVPSQGKGLHDNISRPRSWNPASSVLVSGTHKPRQHAVHVLRCENRVSSGHIPTEFGSKIFLARSRLRATKKRLYVSGVKRQLEARYESLFMTQGTNAAKAKIQQRYRHYVQNNYAGCSCDRANSETDRANSETETTAFIPKI